MKRTFTIILAAVGIDCLVAAACPRCPNDISTTADIYVHGRREAKAGKATELLASQFVPVFCEESVVEEQELVSEMVQ